MSGTLALVGGGEWQPGCEFDRQLLAAAGTSEVVVLPTAAAYEHPERAVVTATEWFRELGASVRGLMVLRRSDAVDREVADVARQARFLYLSGGSPLHLRSVLKESPLWEAIVAAWHDGAVVAGSGAGAMVLCEPMVDPRGGALTVGLGLVTQMAILPHGDHWSEERARRTRRLAQAGLPIITIDERTALLRDPDGGWRAAGEGQVTISVDGHDAGLDALPS